jgi:hypothetical protein
VPCTSRALFRGGIELRRFDEAIVYRTKVWEYPGVNTFRTGRLDELAMHPTVKPVAMLADAIRDVTKRGAVVLDPFAGSGSTLIAGRKGRPSRAVHRIRAQILRRDRAALAGLHRQGRHLRGYWSHF